MDLHTTRNLEKFLEMANLIPERIESQLCFREEPFTVFLEIRQDRLLLTSAYEQESTDAARLLPILLQEWSPERFDGVVQRIFVLHNAVMLSCAPAAASQAELWYRLYLRQRQLLNSAVQTAA